MKKQTIRKGILLLLITLLVISIVGCSLNEKELTTDDLLSCNPGTYHLDGLKDGIKNVEIDRFDLHSFSSYDNNGQTSCKYSFNFKESRLISGSEVTGLDCYFNVELYNLIKNDSSNVELYNSIKSYHLSTLLIEFDLLSECGPKYW